MYVRMFLGVLLPECPYGRHIYLLAVCLFATCSLLALIVCMFNSIFLWACVRLANVYSHLQKLSTSIVAG